MAFINIGFGNIINTDKVVSIVTPDSAPAKQPGATCQGGRQYH